MACLRTGGAEVKVEEGKGVLYGVCYILGTRVDGYEGRPWARLSDGHDHVISYLLATTAPYAQVVIRSTASTRRGVLPPPLALASARRVHGIFTVTDCKRRLGPNHCSGT